MNEHDTYRHLVRTPTKEFLDEVTKLRLYGVATYSKDFLMLFKLAQKHNWTFDEAIQVIVEAECNKEIEAATNKMRDIESIVRDKDSE